MERAAVAVFAQFLLRGLIQRMTHLVYVINATNNLSFLLVQCRLVCILFIVYK